MDYKAIIEGLQDEAVINLMTQLGADRYKEEDDYIIFPTICHNANPDEASMKLYFYKDTKLFVCYTEDGNMSIFNFLVHYYQTRQIDFDWKEDVYDVVMNCSLAKTLPNFEQRYRSIKGRYTKRKAKELDVIHDGILNVFNKFYTPEWLNDGISKETMDKFNILYSISQNKIIIPHYNVNNELVGIRGRALDPYEVENIGKYMPVKIEQTWYKHPLSLNLYGLNKTIDNIKKNGYVYIFESEKSVLQMDGFEQDNCAVAVCGSTFNKYQLNILLKECQPKEIIICFDNEELPGSEKYFNKLWKICQKYKNYCNFSFIYDRENLLDLKDSPTDKGEEVFNELKKRRVKVK